MSGFISNIISRHTSPVDNISPRLPGRYEAAQPAAFSMEGLEQTQETIAVNNDTIQPDSRQTDSTPDFFQKTISPSQPVQYNTAGEGLADHPASPLPVLPDITLTATRKEISSVLPLAEADHGVHPLPFFFNRTADSSGENQPASIITNVFTENNEQVAEQSQPVAETVLPHRAFAAATEMENSNTVSVFPQLVRPALQQALSSSPAPVMEMIPQQTGATIIKVSIGRIDVRAITTAVPVKNNRDTVQKPQLSLDEYLKKRNSAEK